MDRDRGPRNGTQAALEVLPAAKTKGVFPDDNALVAGVDQLIDTANDVIDTINSLDHALTLAHTGTRDMARIAARTAIDRIGDARAALRRDFDSVDATLAGVQRDLSPAAGMLP